MKLASPAARKATAAATSCWLAHAMHRHVLDHRLAQLVLGLRRQADVAADQRRLDRPRADDVDADALIDQLGGEVAAERAHARLGGRVHDVAGDALLRADRSDQHDVPPRCISGSAFCTAKNHALEVDAVQLVPVSLGDLPHRHEGADPRGDEQHIELAEAPAHLGHQMIERGHVGDVDAHGLRPMSHGRGGAGERGRIAPGDDHAPALARRSAAPGEADATVTADDQYRLAGKAHASSPSARGQT